MYTTMISCNNKKYKCTFICKYSMCRAIWFDYIYYKIKLAVFNFCFISFLTVHLILNQK